MRTPSAPWKEFRLKFLSLIFALWITASSGGCGGIKTAANQSSPSSPNPTSAVTSNVAVSNVTTNSAVVAWRTNFTATSQVQYGTSTSYRLSTPLDPLLSTSHTRILAGLAPGTVYHFRVVSIGRLRRSPKRPDRPLSTTSGEVSETENPVFSTDFTFTTLSAQGSGPAPGSGVLAISGVSAVRVSNTSTDIVWNTTQPADSQVQYGTSTDYASSTPVNPHLVTSHSDRVTGLDSNTDHHFSVVSRDTSGAMVESNDFVLPRVNPPSSQFPGLAAGIGWHELPGTAFNTANGGQPMCPPDGGDPGQNDLYRFSSNCKGFFTAWNGGLADTTNNRLILWGGGHGDYLGNEVYALNLASNPVKITRLTHPTVPTLCFPTSGCEGIKASPNAEELPAFPIATIGRDNNNTVTVTTTKPHNFTVGTQIEVRGTGNGPSGDAGFDMVWGSSNPQGTSVTINSVPDSFTVTYTDPGILVPPYNPQTLSTCIGGSICYGAVHEWSGTTGAPNSRHTYNGIEFLPSTGQMFSSGGALAGGGGATNQTWTLDNLSLLTETYERNPAPVWRHHFLTPTPSGAYIHFNAGGCGAYDSNSDKIIFFDTSEVYVVDVVANTSNRLTNNANLGADHWSCVVDPDLKLFYMMGYATPTTGAIKVVDISNLSSNNVPVQDWMETSSGSACNPVITAPYPGLAYDPVNRAVVAVPTLGGGTYYVMTPDKGNQRFTCASATPPGPLPPMTIGRGVFGHFRYFPGPDIFVMDYDYATNAWFLRIR